MTTPPDPTVPQYGGTPGGIVPVIQDYTWFADVGVDYEAYCIPVTPEGSRVVIANVGTGNAYYCVGILPSGPTTPGPVYGDGIPFGIPVLPGTKAEIKTRHSVWVFGDTEATSFVVYTVTAA